MLLVVNNEARQDTLAIFSDLVGAAFPGNEKMVSERYEIRKGIYMYLSGVFGVLPDDDSGSGM